MRRFKIGQKVYSFNASELKIIEGTITGAIKDLKTKNITYKIAIPSQSLWSSPADGILLVEHAAEGLYSSYKKIYAEYKTEMLYGKAIEKIKLLENNINKIFTEYADKITIGNLVTAFEPSEQKLYINGMDNDVKSEFEELHAEIESLKKKTKKTKKSKKVTK